MSGKYNIKRMLGAAVMVMLLATGCKKITEGFLSDGLYVPDSPIKIERGNPFQKTSSLIADGTTQPMTVTLLDIRRVDNKKHADEFFQEYPVYVYTAAIDPNVDTTIEQVNAKRVLKKMKPFAFLESGQFVFNAATDSVPVDVDYEYDVQVTNVAGSKVYKNIGLLRTIDPPLYELTGQGCAWFQDFTTTSGNIGDLKINISRISGSGTSVIVKISDQFGTPFDPKTGQIIKRGTTRPTFESYAKFHPVEYTDSTMACNYEITPFPVKQIPGFGYLIYYRIPSQFVILDKSIPNLPSAPCNVNPRFGFQIKKAGTYLIDIRLPKTTKKAG
ncbi:uncharacterized protein DUF5007 [Chitinophaga niastensis]|uniref:Uncharacterized protein DUF5007 n=1 Tax=Chitinophaga niastensis TaxID=536980 RepID=A0A2P8HJV8_CHINA|nr:DUF5007 domain-containing protein [Chitinophaga niastensis]PSL46460.1 uncharacterized protein DUF5007 [Chitinophaga niastensis]